MWPVAVDRIQEEPDGDFLKQSVRNFRRDKKVARDNNEMTVRLGCPFSFFSRNTQ